MRPPSRVRPKVLVLDGDSKAAAECVLALQDTCTLHVSGHVENCLSFASRRPVQRCVQPVFTDDLRAWIEARDREENYDLIIPATEVSLLALKGQALDSALRAKAAIPGEAAIDIALDKSQTLALAKRLGIKIPWSVTVTDDGDIPPWRDKPVVLKPAHSKVDTPHGVIALSVQICKTEEDRNEAYKRLLPLAPVLEQEYFRGQGIGIGALFEHGEPRWLFTMEQIHEIPVTGGISTYRRSVDAPAHVQDAAIKLLRQLEWHGVALVEFKVAGNGDYRLMEINPRLWESLTLAGAAGVNFPLGLLRLARGETLGPQPPYRRHLYVRDIAKDAIWFAQSWRERRNTLAVKRLGIGDFFALARPLVGAETWDLFRWREPHLWWRLTYGTLTNARKRIRTLAARHAASKNWSRLAEKWREGAISNVLMLCHDDICHGPVAAILLQQAVPEVEAASAGFHPTASRHAPLTWVESVANTLNLDLTPHRSRTVTPEMIARADLIVVMEASDWTSLAKQAPEALQRTVMLGAVAPDTGPRGEEIPDPYCQPPGDMRIIALAIEQCIGNLACQYRKNAPLPRHGTASNAHP